MTTGTLTAASTGRGDGDHRDTHPPAALGRAVVLCAMWEVRERWKNCKQASFGPSSWEKKKKIFEIVAFGKDVKETVLTL